MRDEVAATLEAGLSDPASADAVRSGRLVRALSYAGFGGVDLDGAVAAPGRSATKEREEPDAGRAPPRPRPSRRQARWTTPSAPASA